MRDMSVSTLCPVCREALWENLLASPNARAARISLVHSVQLLLHGGLASVAVAAPPLAEWRDTPPPFARGAEKLRAHLSPLNGRPLLTLRPTALRTFEAHLSVPQLFAVRCWRLSLRLHTAEVRRLPLESSLCFCAGREAGFLRVHCVRCSLGEETTRYACRAKPLHPSLHSYSLAEEASLDVNASIADCDTPFVVREQYANGTKLGQARAF